MSHAPNLPRLTRVCLAALTACALAPVVHADEGDEPLGIERAVTLPTQAKGNPPIWAGKAFQQGVVTAGNPYGAAAGAKMLEQGGNAVDAAVAIAYALNVVEPQSAGIGGGGFMMIHLARTGQTFFVDTREKAPAGATPGMFVGVPSASLQGVAVGVPGMVRGTALALERWGQLSLAQTLQPAIELADAGFAATPRYAAVSCNPRSQNSPESAAFFCPGGGNIGPTAGQHAAPDCHEWPRLLLPGHTREGLRYRQGHRRRPEVQPPAGAQRQGWNDDPAGLGQLPAGGAPTSGRHLPRLLDQGGGGALAGGDGGESNPPRV
jgi:Gamma-glutamyltranspeptidase